MRYRFLRFPEGKPKAVTLSYDDGVREDIRLSEIVSSYCMKATFNINSALMSEDSNDRHLSANEIQEHILDKGHEIAVHGANHVAMGIATPINGIIDVLKGRSDLEKRFKQIVRGMAYPDSGINLFDCGNSYEQIKHSLSKLGIAYARTACADNNAFEMPDDWHAWMPTTHHNNPKAMEWANEFVKLDINQKFGTGRRPRLYYLWGHSYEFERHDNWEVLEGLCEKLAYHDDIWYATNMEIYEYVMAYQSLVFSVDNSMVSNPTMHTVWFDVDGEQYKISPGETILIANL